MRVLIVNTSEITGGAAIAANRLMHALNSSGVKAKMLVRDKQTDNPNVVKVGGKLPMKWRFLWERFLIYVSLHFSRKRLFEIDTASCGYDITQLPEFKEANVIHLHWINQGFLSLYDIRKILASGKAVVWTMHDMWPFTSICHHSGTCNRFQRDYCYGCPLLESGNTDLDLSSRVSRRKKKVYNEKSFTFIGCSKWITDRAIKSMLLKGKNVVHINNALDTRRFSPADRKEVRSTLSLPLDKKLILFAAQNVTDKRKGMDYLIEALAILKKNNTQLASSISLVVMGGNASQMQDYLDMEVISMGYVSDEDAKARLYQACDAFITPSLFENLPNTIAEAMACGTPCVGFDVGGIPEMIDHCANGYVAKYKDAEDFAKGIVYVLQDTGADSLSHSARSKAVRAYDERNIARAHLDVYHDAIAEKCYDL